MTWYLWVIMAYPIIAATTALGMVYLVNRHYPSAILRKRTIIAFGLQWFRLPIILYFIFSAIGYFTGKDEGASGMELDLVNDREGGSNNR